MAIKAEVVSSHHTATTKPELPITVKEAARFLGISGQTLYPWVERKQIPHLRAIGQNICFRFFRRA